MSFPDSLSSHPSGAPPTPRLKSALWLTVYLAVSMVLAGLSLLGIGYAAQLQGLKALLPYAAMGSMLLWFALGAWHMRQQQQRLQAQPRPQALAVQRPTVASLTSDAPWELQAFWTHPRRAGVAAPPATAQQRPSLEPWARARTPSMDPALDPAVQALLRHPLDLVVDAVHPPTRPISLFGDAQPFSTSS